MALIGITPPAAKTAASAPSSSGNGELIRDGSLATFSDDVIAASQTVPVIVDFWAPWCGPCKQLTPTLEKLVSAAKGKVRLVKINVDENPDLAQQMRVQSIPTVYAFVGGQPVTGFAGAQPESQVKSLIDKLVQSVGPADDEQGSVVEAAQAAQAALAAGELQQAAGLFSQLMQENPDDPEAIGGLARCLIQGGELDEARELLGQVSDSAKKHTAVMGASAALEIASQAGELGDPIELEGRLGRDTDDHEARYHLATLLFLRGQIDAAMQHLAEIVKRDRAWRDDAGRRQLLRFFDALGANHPATIKGRRMLSALLFS